MTPSTRAVFAWVLAWALFGLAVAGRTRLATSHLRHASDLDFFNLSGFTLEARDFQWMLRAPGAEDRFSSLVNEASPPARVLGTCGLYLIRSDRFESARDRLSRDDSEVTMGGCLRVSRPVRELAPDLPRFCSYMKMSTSQWGLAEVGWLTGR
jgi:hypothetical protein